MKAIHIQKFIFTLLILTAFVFSSFVYSQSSNSNKVTKVERQKHPNNFTEFFPDKNLALLVAERLNKTVNDNVSIKELAGIKGYFEVGPGAVSNLTGIGYLTGIDSFNCYKNEVTEIPAEIGELINLTSLDLCKAFSLNKIPAEIGKLKKLKYIRLSLTEVKNIPNEIGNLTELTTLLLGSNELTEIPKEIGNLKKLKELYIGSNNLKNVPDEICNLTSLTDLNISHCGLERLPDNIGNLKELQKLNLNTNNLKYLPKSIVQLNKLSRLNVFDNFKLNESYKTYLPELLRKK